MLPGAPPDDEELGARIRALRADRGVSLRALAGELGISPSALSQMERGKMRPSVTRLFQIVSILEVPLAAAFGETVPGAEPEAPLADEPEFKPDDVVVARADDVHGLSLGHGVSYRRLTPVPIPGVEIFESTYPPCSSSSQDGEYLRHHGHETGSVLSGRLVLDIGFETYELGPGDSIRFPSTTPHRIRNTGETPAVAVWVNLV